MRAAVVVFPGTWSDNDCVWALQTCGIEARKVWHRDVTAFDAEELVVLPGGFSYGDYLRCGAIAQFSPAMEAVVRHAEAGGLVIGICNGFQILCESHLLPGVLMRNDSLQFRCQDAYLVPENRTSPFTASLDPSRGYMIPVSHGEGRYVADEETVTMLESTGRIAFRYGTLDGRVTPEANPNGSTANIAGILNERGNVLGMMPHPERACEPLLGNEDGNAIWRSVLDAVGVTA
ncbi:MAG: phosphoribosylformylglycinamidine synthase subunit PurQ [Chloroflexi bacterium]|nr:phosphoribosylformylglycinamidine synthase subunit PurQ [Chloroflexota bacterium]MQC16815.1 phosphoribosylformylglycinamidine synthase subunit PurQ [Chloroflexota bacterium]